jgi:chromosomal replication initiator protein
MTNEEIWQAVLGELELTISRATFTTWFKSTYILSQNEGEFVISVPNGFAKEWLENKFQKEIAKCLQSVTSTRIKRLSFCLNSKKDIFLKGREKIATIPSVFQPKLKEEVQIIQEEEVINEYNLNPRYTFENFIVGPNNELAKAAALAVTKSPGKTYNPLFIYGGVGLGKTHLVQAIGNKVCEVFPKKRVVYVSCEKFIEDFITFIQKGKDNNFKNKYRKADYLLTDDIQFLAGKEGTQEEFFHTFNYLYQNNKQIVLTSDRPPKAILGLEDRLVSRFEGGMIADISMPNLETRRAILLAKCKERKINVPENVLNYIAANIQNNIRELEGTLSRLIARCQLNNLTPTEELARHILTNIVGRPNKKALTSKRILETVAGFYNIKLDELVAKNRKKEVAWPRQIAMYLIRDETKTSYPTIGQEIGGRDHTTAIHAYEKVSREIEKDINLRQEIDIIRQKLYTS